MKDESVIQHLMDIKERLSKVETNTKNTKELVEANNRNTKELVEGIDHRVDKIEKDLNQAKGSIKGIKWVTGFMLVTIPSVAYTLVKLLSP